MEFILSHLGLIVFIFLLFVAFLSSFTIIQQGTVGVTQVFGKFKRVLGPGLNFKTPFIEQVVQVIPTQNQTSELSFQAITKDQANVHFSAMLLYSVLNDTSENIKLVAYKFNDSKSFAVALSRSIESSIRSFIATKDQADILELRQEIVTHVKASVDTALEQWGYHLIDLQINDIGFDEEVTESMARVVAALNNKKAAENEGEAMKIRTQKEAEAYANASIQRAKGLSEARAILNNSMKGLDPQVLAMLNMDKYCDTMKDIAQNGQGKIIFIDTTAGSFNTLMANMHTLDGTGGKADTETEKK